MKNRQMANCQGDSEKFVKLNTDALKQYKPNAVPRYYLEGRSVSFSALRKKALPKKQFASSVQTPSAATSGVRTIPVVSIDWDRYSAFLINDKDPKIRNVALVVGPSTKESGQIIGQVLKDTRFNWYVFWIKPSNEIESLNLKNALNCPSSSSLDIVKAINMHDAQRCNGDKTRLSELSEEFQLLMDVKKIPTVFVAGRMAKLNEVFSY